MLTINFLALSQLLSFPYSTFVLLITVGRFLPELNIFVSSASSLGSKWVANGISLTYKVIRIGPRMDPCGTPLQMCLMGKFFRLQQYIAFYL